MTYPNTKEDYYDRIKGLLEADAYKVNPYRTIQYGLQFIVFKNDISGIIRIYDGKKGLRLDLSQIKDEVMNTEVSAHLAPIESEAGKLLKFSKKVSQSNAENIIQGDFSKDPDEIIGIDESGKGDYFGPLVVAACYSNLALNKKLRALGVDDSKKMSDEKILEIAPKIKDICAHSLIVLANKSYNDIYFKIQNLNHVLAWGHARVLENVLEQQDCDYALSDQFGNPNLIRAKLYTKGQNITLFSRPRAESNVAVAAASVLARAAYLEQMADMSEKLKVKLKKGSSAPVLKMAQKLIDTHGKGILPYIAKLHFKLTDQLELPEDKDRKKFEKGLDDLLPQ